MAVAFFLLRTPEVNFVACDLRGGTFACLSLGCDGRYRAMGARGWGGGGGGGGPHV